MLPEDIFLLKVIFTVAFVIILSLITERLGPRFAGILLGLPTGTAITLFFFGLEISPEFAAKSAVFNLAGVAAMHLLFFVYYRASINSNKKGIFYAAILSILTYLSAAAILRLIGFTIWTSILVPAISIPVTLYLFKDVKDTIVKKKTRLTTNTILTRSLITAAIIIAVTESAKHLGPQWAGLFSAFPTTVFPLMIIIHYTHGAKHVHTILKNIPKSQGAVVFYSLGVFYLYPKIGIIYGTIIAYLFVGLYMLIFWVLTRPKQKPLKTSSRTYTAWRKKRK